MAVIKGFQRCQNLGFQQCETSIRQTLRFPVTIHSTVGHAAQISGQVTSAQVDAMTTELVRLIEQVKSTGQCRNCNLAGADLAGLEIVSCDLSFANLMGAKLVLTNLASCNRQDSKLSQADFTQANMAGANLTQTDISRAFFMGANTDGVIGAQTPGL